MLMCLLKTLQVLHLPQSKSKTLTYKGLHSPVSSPLPSHCPPFLLPALLADHLVPATLASQFSYQHTRYVLSQDICPSSSPCLAHNSPRCPLGFFPHFFHVLVKSSFLLLIILTLFYNDFSFHSTTTSDILHSVLKYMIYYLRSTRAGAFDYLFCSLMQCRYLEPT